MAELLEMPDRTPPDSGRGRPPDWRERERALDVTASWVVEAPAGSGKTGLLIQRYLKLLADGGVERPEQVLAITFTKAATEEIRERVISAMEEAAAGTEVQGSAFAWETRGLAEGALRRDREMGWNLLQSPQRLRVRTIDSVCAEIARALPVTSGGAAGMVPVERPDALYLEASRRTLLELGGADAALHEALRTVLLHRAGRVDDCEALLAEMLKTREQWGGLIPLRPEELTEEWLERKLHGRLDAALEDVVCRGLTELKGAIPEGMLLELTALARQMAYAEDFEDFPSPMRAFAGLSDTPGETVEDLQHWHALVNLLVKKSGGWRARFQSDLLRFTWDKEHTKPMKGLIASLQEQEGALHAIDRFQRLPPPQYPEEQWVVAKALFRVLRRALVELQVVFGERGECDFSESALLARSALRQEHGVEGYERSMGIELRHLLVDEMQDTSTGQYELIEMLTEGWGSEGKTVFLVGDPKQSIYLFRQARVERFVRLMTTERMGELPVKLLRLRANFRSQAGLVQSFNEDFALVFPAGDEAGSDVPFVAAEAVRAPGRGGRVWHAERASGAVVECGEQKRRAVRRHAQTVRKLVEGWRSRPLPPGRTDPWKIAVLVRSRSELREIVAALRGDEGREQIPFQAVKVEPLKERREVLDLLALTRALLHPADRVAWWAVLRAPWCGLGLSDLHVLAGEDDREMAETTVLALLAERGEFLPPESIARLERVWPVLEAAMEQRSKTRVPELVERTWRSLGGDAALGEVELRNAVRYLELLEELDREGAGVEPGELQGRMEGLFAAAGGEPGAVDLMTMHGAKGLEWDAVLVPEMERKSPSVPGRLLEWEEIEGDEKGVGAKVMLAPIAGKGEDSRELNVWLRGLQTARQTMERKRLFYVACTRAREELHLFGTANVLKDGKVKAESSSMLEAAWPAAKRWFVADGAVEEREPGAELALAAGADEPARGPVMVERLPKDFDARARFGRRRPATAEERGRGRLARPEGSFAARSFGNAVHAFLELAAMRMAQGVPWERLRAETEGWKGRVAAVLRGDGHAPATAERMARRVLQAVNTTLREPTGRWVLGARVDARSEYPMALAEGGRVRLDRIFRAGAEPGSDGAEFLWIVDFKTGRHGPEGVEAFLERERLKYAGQIEGYARVVGESAVRVALWYPMLGRLVWWVV